MEHQSAIDVLLAQARGRLDRVEPERIADEVAAGAILVDIRPIEQRQRDGELTGAMIIDRNVLEWRLDPTSPDRLPLATGADIRYLVIPRQPAGTETMGEEQLAELVTRDSMIGVAEVKPPAA